MTDAELTNASPEQAELTKEPAPQTAEAQAAELTLARPELPEGMTWDEGFEKAALTAAQAAGLSQAQAQGLADFYAAHQAQAFQAASSARLGEETRYRDTIRAEFGPAFEAKVAQAARAARHFGGQELAEWLNESGAGNHPALVRAFARIGAAMAEDTLKTGKGDGLALSPFEARQEARRLMAKEGYTNGAHPEHFSLVEQVRAMFERAYQG